MICLVPRGLAKQDWAGVVGAKGVDAKVEALHLLYQKGTNFAYVLKSRKKKSSEPVWMTDGIRDMIKKRRKLFRRLKRRGNWNSLKKWIEDIVE